MAKNIKKTNHHVKKANRTEILRKVAKNQGMTLREYQDERYKSMGFLGAADYKRFKALQKRIEINKEEYISQRDRNSTGSFKERFLENQANYLLKKHSNDPSQSRPEYLDSLRQREFESSIKFVSTGSLDTLMFHEDFDELSSKKYDLLKEGMKRLTPLQHNVFALYEFFEYSNSEIAQLIGISLSCVRTHYSDARKRIKSFLIDSVATS